MEADWNSPEEWLRYARGDLDLAIKGKLPGIMLEPLCFHAQQAVEKALKAVLVFSGQQTPRIHSIERLIDNLPADVKRGSDFIVPAILTAFATGARYPWPEEPVSEVEYEEAVRLAESIVEWAEKVIHS
jgi:HEPN domain-containing protein